MLFSYDKTNTCLSWTYSNSTDKQNEEIKSTHYCIKRKISMVSLAGIHLCRLFFSSEIYPFRVAKGDHTEQPGDELGFFHLALRWENVFKSLSIPHHFKNILQYEKCWVVWVSIWKQFTFKISYPLLWPLLSWGHCRNIPGQSEWCTPDYFSIGKTGTSLIFF